MSSQHRAQENSLPGFEIEVLPEETGHSLLDDLLLDQSQPKIRANFNGVFVGKLRSLDNGNVLVEISDMGIKTARCTVAISASDLGKEVAIMFEQGDPGKALLMGIIQQPIKAPLQNLQAEVDDERLVLAAEREIVLKCGNASITLTRAGKILIRGAYVSSRSSGVNRIKGGSVQIN